MSLAAAELPALARHAEGADEVADTLERLVDTTTACAVQLDDTGRLTPGTPNASSPCSTNSPGSGSGWGWARPTYPSPGSRLARPRWTVGVRLTALTVDGGRYPTRTHTGA